MSTDSPLALIKDSSFKKNISDQFQDLSSLYFNSAYFGPTPKFAKQHLDLAIQREFNPSFYPYSDWIKVHQKIRLKLAELLGLKEATSLSLGTSVTDFVTQIAWCLKRPSHQDTQPKNAPIKVLTFEKEYPSNVLPWIAVAEARPRELVVTRAQILDSLQVNDPHYWQQLMEKHRPEVINLSWVAFDTGRMIPLSLLKHLKETYGVFIILDGTQGLGATWPDSTDLTESVDVFLCSTYKWMLGPYGQAFGYFSKEALAWLPYVTSNWIAGPSAKDVHHLTSYQMSHLEEQGAERFDRGQTPNMLSNACFSGALEFYEQMGTKKIAQYNKELAHYFYQSFAINGLNEHYDLMTPEHPSLRAQIVALKSKQPFALEERLKSFGIDVSLREGNLRISLHVFNTMEQVDQLLNALGNS